jgi:hypothetical protein
MAEVKVEEPVASLEQDLSGTVNLTSIEEKSFPVEKKFAFISKLVSQAMENGASCVFGMAFETCVDRYECNQCSSSRRKGTYFAVGD